MVTGSLKQYTDLYALHADTVNANSAAPLNSLRGEALAFLEQAGHLPYSSDEGYEKTSVDELFAPDYGLNIARLNIPADVAAAFRCGVPNMSSLLGITVNDRFVPSRQLLDNCPEGLTVCTLSEAADRFPDIIARHYGALTARHPDTPSALNTLFAQDGVFIHIRRGTCIDKPLQLVNLFQAPAPLMAPRRILLVAEENAHLAVLKCDHTNPGSQKCLSSEVVELVLGRGSRVEWYDIEESSPETTRLSQLYASQAEGTSLSVCSSTLLNGSTRNEFYIDTPEAHTETRLAAMAIGSGTQHIDNFSQVTHSAEHARSSQLFKYVLDEEASGAFEGGIEVCHSARFVEAYQSNRNILASTKARMHSKPQLLIYNDDVKCSHGATTGQLDSDALFYMQTRGIPLDEARRMLMQAFMVDVIDHIELSPLRDRLRHMVERRFSGSMTCASCANSQTDSYGIQC